MTPLPVTILDYERPTFILMAVEEDAYYFDGIEYSSPYPYWVSGPLNVAEFKDQECTLRKFSVEYYTSNFGSFRLYFSGDGGTNWASTSYDITDATSYRGTRWTTVYPTVSGKDLRVKIEFRAANSRVTSIVAFEPEIILRGDGAVS